MRAYNKLYTSLQLSQGRSAYDAAIPYKQSVQESATIPSEIQVGIKWVFQLSFTDRKYYELCV